jgi:hypothetical protein
MASTYSQYKIELVGTGEQAGTWGTTTNNNFGSATPGTYQGFEQAIGGRADVTMSGTTTLSLTNSNAAQDARALYLNLSGTLSGAADLVVPALQKSYLVKNGTTGGFAVTIKVIGQTGVSIPNGKTVWVYNNGTDIVTAVDFIPEIATTTVDATNIEVTNIKAKDGTSAGSIADSTGVMTITTLVGTNDATVNGLTVGRGAGAVASNTAVGASALATNSAGTNSTAVGRLALTTNSTGANLTAVGAEALKLTTVGNNTAVGAAALFTNSTGQYNVALGQHDASGFPTLYSNDTGSNNTGIGSGALAKNTTADNNTAVGYQSLYTNVTSPELTAIGYQSLYASTDGYNTAIGFKAGFSQTTGNSNTYIGRYVAGTAATTTGSNNTAMGNRSLQAVTSGSANVSIGAEALQANTTASDNTAVGRSALYTNTTGASNVAVGQSALLNNTTASNNTAVGYQAGYNNETGDANVYIGRLAGFTGTTARLNTFVGDEAGGLITTGASNTFIGNDSGYAVTTGSNNSILGAYNGNQGGLDIRTLSNYIVLSDGAGNPLVSTADNQTVALEGAVPNSGTGITFPATQSASSNAHTLDDYEEGTWSAATITAVNATGVSFSEGRYTKIGNFVHVQGKFTLTVTTANTLTYVFMVLPFTPLLTTTGSLIDNVSLVAGTAQASSNGSAYAFIAASASNPAGATDWFVSYEYQV